MRSKTIAAINCGSGDDRFAGRCWGLRPLSLYLRTDEVFELYGRGNLVQKPTLSV